MLIDNKNEYSGKLRSLYDYLRKHTKAGSLDVVSGFFSIQMLARMWDELNDPEQFRMILGELIKDGKLMGDLQVDLLTEKLTIERGFEKKHIARKAVKFLEQEKVELKTVKPNFCHAKAYLYTAPNEDTPHNFFITGSSNLTEAGMGIKDSANVELNLAKTGEDNEFPDLKKWFKKLWESPDAKSEIGGKIFKQELINEISKLYREYTPLQLYYKVLFEFFKEDLLGVENDPELQREIKRLETTTIYQALYQFQKDGVWSLIRKLRDYNGAILADAVGLGKTWTSLAVIKYFEMRGYEVVVLCPKKLGPNWERYHRKLNSPFKSDRFDYTVRYHTDLQDERLSKYGLTLEDYFQGNSKLLLVIDESHNLRNDKSNRFQFLVNKILRQNEEVKVLMLSATPINTKLTDLRNQYQLMVKGNDAGFAETQVQVNSITRVFADVQAALNNLQGEELTNMQRLVEVIPRRFFELTDATVVARRRQTIAKQLKGQLDFPRKDKPRNQYIGLVNIGNLKSFQDILEAIDIWMTAYKPAHYTRQQEDLGILHDEVARQNSLGNMMYVLLIKRLESSWYSFYHTVGRLLTQHQLALDKVLAFEKSGGADAYELEQDDFLENDLEETDQEQEADYERTRDFSIGKKNPVRLADMVRLPDFKRHLQYDINRLGNLRAQLQQFNQAVEEECNSGSPNKSCDPKLERLMEVVREKQLAGGNPKVLIFTVFKDTAQYLYRQLTCRGFSRVAYVSGDQWQTDHGDQTSRTFEPLLERFAPYTKLYRERNWRPFYEKAKVPAPADFVSWKEFIFQHQPKVQTQLEQPIDILIATDCLSEGQNLQDCDLVINYDIHWNPVRLIQRFGRIDRLGSPNSSIAGVNFWPGGSYEEYLQLKSRIEERIAKMALLGIDLDVPIDEAMEERLKNNPILSEQEERMLEQLQQTWEDLEDGGAGISFDKLTLEDYRQELYELLDQKRKELEEIPNGVFTGFKCQPDLLIPEVPQGLVALVRFTGNRDPADKESNLYLLYTTPSGVSVHRSNQEVLAVLRRHKLTERFVPPPVDQCHPNAIKELARQVSLWMNFKAGRVHEEEVQDLFANGSGTTTEATTKSKTEQKLEDKFQLDNFELIVWFVIT